MLSNLKTFFIFLLLVTGSLVLGHGVEAQFYEPTYCYTESRVASDFSYDPNDELTYCFSSSSRCNSDLSNRQEGFRDSRFVNNCDNSRVAPPLCQANTASCQEIRLSNSNSAVIGSPTPYTICAPDRNKCGEISDRERSYWAAQGWAAQAIGCNVPQNRLICELIDDVASGGGGNESVGNWCYERRATVVGASWEEVCLSTEVSCLGEGENDQASPNYIVRKDSTNEVICTDKSAGGSENNSQAYCFNPTLNNTTGIICTASQDDCQQLRFACNTDGNQCSIDNDATYCAATTIEGASANSAYQGIASQFLGYSSQSDFNGIQVSYASSSGQGAATAVGGSSSSGGSGAQSNTGRSNGPANIVDCKELVGSEYCLQDPLTQNQNCYYDFENNVEVCEAGPNTIFSIIYIVITALTNVLIPLSVLAIIYGGFQFIVARGDPGKITDAKKTLRNIAIGVILIVSARILIEIVASVITSI